MRSQNGTGRASRSRFERGSGCFTCESCGRKTRQTGEQGGNPICPLCFDQAGWQNAVSDYGSEPDQLADAIERSREDARAIYAKGGVFSEGWRGAFWAEVSRIDEIHTLALAAYAERFPALKLTGSMNWEAPIGPDGREALPLTTVKEEAKMTETKAKAKRTRVEVPAATIAAIIKARDGGATWGQCDKIAPRSYQIYWKAVGAEARAKARAAVSALKAWETRRNGAPKAKAPAKAKAKAPAKVDAKREATLARKREAEKARRARLKAAARK